MLLTFATSEASTTAASGRGVVASMWHTSSACAFVNSATRNTVKSIGGEGEKRFTVKSRDNGLSPMRIMDS